MCFSPQRRAIFQHQHLQKCSRNAVFCTFSLPNVLFATAACNFWFIRWPPDSAPAALTGLLFDWPDTRIIEKTQHFVTSLTFSADVSSFTWLWHYCIFCRLTFLMCFSPQRRAIFRHQNFKKFSEDYSFLTFSLPNVLFTTAACNFSTSALTKVLSECGVLYMFTSECAFRHSGVQFLIYPLTTWLRTRRFNRPTFRLTRHTNHWKNTAFRDFSNI